MASRTIVPVEEYLKMSFEGPEPDYVDGELIERRLGSIPHFEAQERLLEFFRSLKQSHSLFSYPEVTLKISQRHYRVADVAVFGRRPTGTKYPSEVPTIVIEVVSEDDRHVEIQEKLAEYHDFGVKNIWLVDPWTKKLSVFENDGLHAVAAFELPEFNVTISAKEIFAD